mmetsp:Transcript_1190/g.2320  ORF Transcript_1190/g.2320 Transcript_1190/m.2320 type:complete len:229 (+) Transcript_1190:124-810(+)
MIKVATNSNAKIAFSCCCFGTNFIKAEIQRGIHRMARYPKIKIKMGDTTNGEIIANAVGFFMAPSSDKIISAITSSKIAAAIINCPVGVLRSLAPFNTLSAIPIEVGPKHAPAAILTPMSSPKHKYEMQKPSEIGKMLPITATPSAGAPITLRSPTSTSTPASTTSMIRPISPITTRISEPASPGKLIKCGPKMIPNTISPTNAGICNFSANLPANHNDAINSINRYT